jgi:drug/metabolite transporter (DMT)-like permease
MQEPKNLQARGIFFIFLSSILFSTKAVAVKLAFRDTPIDAVALLMLRMLFAFPFFLVTGLLALKQFRHTLPTAKQWSYIAAMGLLGYYISSYLDFVGLQYITAGLERLILFLYPSFVVLINYFFFKEKITWQQKLALGLCYLGLIISFYHEVQLDIDIRNLVIGSSLIFLCAITYAGYIAGTGRLLRQVPVMLYTSFALIGSSIAVFVHFNLASNYTLSQLDYRMAYYGLFLGIVATVLPNFLVSAGIQKVGSNNAAIISAIGPISTILLAQLFLHEEMDIPQMVGTVCVIAGVILVSIRSKK